ncbi:hypothetical protein NT07LI_0696a, partial [Listeria innocua FSL S4-378]
LVSFPVVLSACTIGIGRLLVTVVLNAIIVKILDSFIFSYSFSCYCL